MVEFYGLDMDYLDDGSIRVFGRTKDHKRITVLDDSFKPYLWIIADKNTEKIRKKLDNIKVEEKDHIAQVIKTDVCERNYMEKIVKVIRVTVSHPRDFKIIKEEIKKLKLEKKGADINFIHQYLVEKNLTPLTLWDIDGEPKEDGIIKGEIKQKNEEIYPDPKILTFDIEVYGGSVAEDSVKKNPIITIAFYGNKFKKVITWKKTKEENVDVVQSEADLIEKFKEVLNKYDPDYLVGYFSDGYDFPYIKGRAEKYKINLDLGVDKSNLIFRRGGMSNSAKIKGIVHMDIFKFIRRVMPDYLKLDSYSLDNVSKEILGERKYELGFEEMDELWDKGEIKEIIKYNLRDTELTYKLFLQFLPNIQELIKLIGVLPYEICRMSYGTLVESYLIRRSKEFNEIIPNKPSYHDISERREHTYKGAFVMEPKPGLYKNIIFYDFLSLYPTIIISKNISPGTLNKSKGHKTPGITDEKGKKVNYHFDHEK
ncbi:ribonuclease H-like domain-containing protein, partial [archaeon]|nr:ribonuclease H-like domain-containing protein [archaeon]